MSDGSPLPNWLRTLRDVSAVLRELIGLVLVVASLLTAGALWATRSVRADMQQLQTQTRRMAMAVELLVVVNTESDSARRADARRAIVDMRRVVVPKE